MRSENLEVGNQKLELRSWKSELETQKLEVPSNFFVQTSAYNIKNPSPCQCIIQGGLVG